ncbi:GspH/FimT family pseudopilin [Halofilum ochraceum]|uniref:GspH/FimT family pseudopilin n=1 Tax=Halofilum ochraceum TaxID=1611323 RepID=UPI0008DA5729|nr:GspH/FimT family pseudopilin [Halofilum ochraceum]
MKPFRGFTLVELMVTLIIIAVVLSIAVPNFRDFIQDSRATAEANNIVGALNLARSEAIKRSETVSVCASSDQATCNGGGDWDQGWIVFVGDSSSLDEVLRVWEAPGDAVTVGSDVGTFSFDSLGEAEAGDGESIDVDFDACTEPWARRIGINAAGRVNVQRGNC